MQKSFTIKKTSMSVHRNQFWLNWLNCYGCRFLVPMKEKTCTRRNLPKKRKKLVYTEKSSSEMLMKVASWFLKKKKLWVVT